MTEKIRQIIEEAVRGFEEKQEDPRILVLGATGVGKSSLINAIFGKKLAPVKTGPSTTRDFSRHMYDRDGTQIEIIDSPGYGEVGYDEQYSQNVVTEAKNVHGVTLVLKADEKGYERDLRIIGSAGKDPDFSLEKPLLIALNQVDKIKPAREWNPPYEWEAPSDDLGDENKRYIPTEKARNIGEKVSLVKTQFKTVAGKRSMRIIPTMSDEEEGQLFGIDEFKLALFEILPDAARYRFARSANFAENATKEVLEELDKLADKIIAGVAAAAAAAVAVNPVPVSDFAVLIPLQIGMVVKLGALYGKTVDKKSALEIVATLGAGFAARTAFQALISFFPGVKNVLGPPVAAAATYTMGKAAKAYFKGLGVPSPSELKETVEAEAKKREGQGY